jgi:hypothetical protein
MDGWTVFDTAVKIGLGAIITGIVGLRVLARTQAHELRKLNDERYLSSLLFCSEQGAKVAGYIRLYMGELIDLLEEARTRPIPLDIDEVRATLKPRDQRMSELEDAGNALNARLRLLGLESARTHLSVATEEFISFRNSVFGDKRVPELQETRTHGQKMVTAIASFYSALGTAYQLKFQPSA